MERVVDLIVSSEEDPRPQSTMEPLCLSSDAAIEELAEEEEEMLFQTPAIPNGAPQSVPEGNNTAERRRRVSDEDVFDDDLDAFALLPHESELRIQTPPPASSLQPITLSSPIGTPVRQLGREKTPPSPDVWLSSIALTPPTPKAHPLLSKPLAPLPASQPHMSTPQQATPFIASPLSTPKRATLDENPQFTFDYLDHNKQIVTAKDDAMLHLMEGDSVWYSIRFHADDVALVRQVEKRGQLRDMRPFASSSTTKGSYYMARLAEEAAPDQCVTYVAVSPSKTPRKKRKASPLKSTSLRHVAVPPAEAAEEEPAPFDPIVFAPGTFEVVLVIDHREVKEKDDRYHIQRELFRCKIPHETINLAVGDFLWCARQIDTEAPLIVLDHIAERKRIDDLVQSIKDTRFMEQKYRLARCGIAKPTYIVEENKHHLGSIETLPKGMNTIRAALMQTIAVHGFTLKQTPNLEGTITYLKCVSALLYERYKDQTLYAVPQTLFTLHDQWASMLADYSQRDNKTYRVTLTHFNALHGKSHAITLRDLWAMQLMSIRGISQYKAAAIIARYPTMQHLLRAYDAAPTLSAKEHLLANWDRVSRTKNIGVPLSKYCYELFMSKTYRPAPPPPPPAQVPDGSTEEQAPPGRPKQNYRGKPNGDPRRPPHWQNRRPS